MLSPGFYGEAACSGLGYAPYASVACSTYRYINNTPAIHSGWGEALLHLLGDTITADP